MVVSGFTVKNNLQTSLNAINHNSHLFPFNVAQNDKLNSVWSYIMAHAVNHKRINFITYLIYASSKVWTNGQDVRVHGTHSVYSRSVQLYLTVHWTLYGSTQAETHNNYCAEGAGMICIWQTYFSLHFAARYLAAFALAMVVNPSIVRRNTVDTACPFDTKNSFWCRLDSTEQCRIP